MSANTEAQGSGRGLEAMKWIRGGEAIQTEIKFRIIHLTIQIASTLTALSPLPCIIRNLISVWIASPPRGEIVCRILLTGWFMSANTEAQGLFKLLQR
jgi:hypothetical protein